MKIKVVASTKKGHIAKHDELIKFGGNSAGICYMQGSLSKLNKEPVEDTFKRANRTKNSKHHSVFEHSSITFDMENIPKLFAMLLNNEKVFKTSEKSARYTKMKLSDMEEYLYKKWYTLFLTLIQEKYGNIPYFSAGRIDKLAKENARYMTSVMTPTVMRHTLDYTQLNYLCGWMKEFEHSTNPIYKMLAPTANEFLNIMDSYGYLDEGLMNNGKNREFSLIGKRVREEQFGECYSVNYKLSLASYAQAQRHRTLHYEMRLPDDVEFYVPRILTDSPSLVEEWIKDMKSVASLMPQGRLVDVNERGDYENLILKAKERLCTAAQIEVMQSTKNTIDKIIANTTNPYVKEDLEKISKGARCVSGFECDKPCGFIEGINLTREI